MTKKKRKATSSTGLARVSAQAKIASARHEARAEELLELIVRRMKRIQEDFFDIGIALKELKEKKLFVALGHRTFDAMLAKRELIGRSQAYKLIAIVERVTRDQAIELGEEKAYAIARLVATTPEADTVATLLAKGVKVGKGKRAAQSMSRRELDAVKRKIASRSKKSDPAERDAKRAARAAQARLRARRVSARVDVEKRKGHWWAVIHVPVENLSSLVGER